MCESSKSLNHWRQDESCNSLEWTLVLKTDWTICASCLTIPLWRVSDQLFLSIPMEWLHFPHDRITGIIYPNTLRRPLSRQPISGTPEFIILKLVSSLRCSGFCEDENLLLSKLDVTRLTYIYISCSSFWVCYPFSLPFSAAHMDATPRPL